MNEDLMMAGIKNPNDIMQSAESNFRGEMDPSNMPNSERYPG